jgi:hypothetical protein
MDGHEDRVRRATVLGLLLFGVAIAPFGLSSTLPLLDALRFVQGSDAGLSGAAGWPGSSRSRPATAVTR